MSDTVYVVLDQNYGRGLVAVDSVFTDEGLARYRAVDINAEHATLRHNAEATVYETQLHSPEAVAKKLTMRRYLEALAVYGVSGSGMLEREGYHPKVVLAKAEKASSKGYSDYGTSPSGSWIEDLGLVYLGDWSKP